MVVRTLGTTDSDLAALAKKHAAVQSKSAEVDRDVAELLRKRRQEMLEYGATNRLAVDGVIEDLPLDDEAALQAAKPVGPGGRVQVDAVNLEARHDVQVKAAMVSGPVTVLVLGGSHDLSASVRKLGAGTTEYIRVTTRRFNEVAAGHD